MAGNKTKRLVLGLAAGAAVALALVAFGRLDWVQLKLELSRLDPAWLPAAMLANLSVLVFWAWQWVLFLPPKHRVPFSRLLENNSYMALTMNTAPFLAGHALGLALLHKKEGAPPPVALSVLALDQLAEGLAKLTLLALCAALVPLPPWLDRGLVFLAVAVPALAAGLVIWSRLGKAAGFFNPETFIGKALGFTAAWGRQMNPFRRPAVLLSGWALALAMKAAEALAIWAVAAAFDKPLTAGGVLLVLAAVSLASMTQVSPGNLGVYEAAAFVAYRFLGLAPEPALGLALVQHLCYLAPLIGTGCLVLAWRSLKS